MQILSRKLTQVDKVLAQSHFFYKYEKQFQKEIRASQRRRRLKLRRANFSKLFSLNGNRAEQKQEQMRALAALGTSSRIAITGNRFDEKLMQMRQSSP